MSKKKSDKKRVVVTKDKKRVTPTTSKSKLKAAKSEQTVPLVYGKEFYSWMMLGVGLITAGLFCMLGGEQPSPDAWDDSIIYSWRITVLAPLLILAGLGVEIYAIFKK